MRARSIVLEVFRDENTGELGFGLKGMPRTEETNAGTEGLTIAHDLLEHINGPEHIGSIADELEALGAIWFVRGQFGELRRDGVGSYYTVHQNIASDVVRMFRDSQAGGAYVDYSGPRTRAGDCEEDFAEILREADESWRGQFDDEDKRAAAQAWPEYRRLCLDRMRTGYRKARRKYGDARTANDLFWRVARAVDGACKAIDYEGQRFELTISDSRVMCCEHYDADDYA